ncbi:MAG: hypothetical protein J5725_01945 [Bacteroidales bacterium]|nr:hypothetical protein [Bacteroidales bacterium]
MNAKVKNFIGWVVASILVGVFMLTGCLADSLIDNGYWSVAFAGILLPFGIGYLIHKRTTLFDGLVEEDK